MSDPYTRRPPFVADERTTLLGWYALQREIVVWKCRDLSDADAHRALLPTSPLTTVAGIVSHLRWVEHSWYEVAFLGGEPGDNPAYDRSQDDADFTASQGISLGELITGYERQCRRSDDIIAAHDLDEPGRGTLFPSGGATLRWIVTHMVEETARHAGHLDLLREMLDGEVGYS